eukprot:gene27011-17118_t
MAGAPSLLPALRALGFAPSAAAGGVRALRDVATGPPPRLSLRMLLMRLTSAGFAAVEAGATAFCDEYLPAQR